MVTVHNARAIVAYISVSFGALALSPAFLVPIEMAMRAIVGSLYFSIFFVWFFLIPAAFLAVMSSFQPKGTGRVSGVALYPHPLDTDADLLVSPRMIEQQGGHEPQVLRG